MRMNLINLNNLFELLFSCGHNQSSTINGVLFLKISTLRCVLTDYCVSVCHQMGPGSVDQTYYQGRHCGENWGDERKPIFIQQGKKIHISTNKTCSI